MKARLPCVVLALALAGPACRSELLVAVGEGFTVAPASLDLGPVLEGGTATGTFTITSTSRLPRSLEVTVGPPFSAPALVELPAAGEVTLEVAFDAGVGVVTGRLHLGPADAGVDVPLGAEGVRPAPCPATPACVRSTFQLDVRACVASPLPEGAPCDPGDLCLERGACHAGVCQGTARACDDNDACTDDACSSLTGCVNRRHACPWPSDPCRVPTCDPTSGCGTGLAPLGTVCGPADCNTVSGCSFNGQCLTVPTPLGSPCGVQVACLPLGSCQAVGADAGQACVLPDAGDWRPDWSATVEAEPSTEEPVLLASGASVYFEACSPTFSPDGGAADAGAADAGVDAGTVGAEGGGSWCGLVSYTGSGFLRFAAPFEDGRPRRLVHLAGRGVLVQGERGLSYLSPSAGAPLEALELLPPLDGVAAAADGAVLLLGPDGGLFAWAQDAGAAWLLDTEATVLSLDARGQAFLLAPRTALLERVAFLEDGGLELSRLVLDGGAAALTVAGGRVVAQGAWVASLDDAGVWQAVALEPAGEPELPVRGGGLQTPGVAALFTLRCPTPELACARAEAELWLSSFELTSGARLGELQAATADPRSRLVLAGLLDLQPPEVAVAAVTVVGFDGGARAGLQVFSGGRRTLVCPFPEASTDVLGAALGERALFVLSRRPDGGVALESYGLGVAPVHRLDWAAPFGEAGTRRAR